MELRERVEQEIGHGEMFAIVGEEMALVVDGEGGDEGVG